ncbi:MAG: hypothetical protein OEN50_09415 [Deltaproteobacteria bacterium]|nr:hypothetical protein [Deltaproteobacteria bacterium]
MEVYLSPQLLQVSVFGSTEPGAVLHERSSTTDTLKEQKQTMWPCVLSYTYPRAVGLLA